MVTLGERVAVIKLKSVLLVPFAKSRFRSKNLKGNCARKRDTREDISLTYCIIFDLDFEANARKALRNFLRPRHESTNVQVLLELCNISRISVTDRHRRVGDKRNLYSSYTVRLEKKNYISCSHWAERSSKYSP